MTHRARAFLRANAAAPVVYASATEHETGLGCTFRLSDGQVFRLSPRDVARLPDVRWAWRDGTRTLHRLRKAA